MTLPQAPSAVAAMGKELHGELEESSGRLATLFSSLLDEVK